jgi:hypothetical protein
MGGFSEWGLSLDCRFLRGVRWRRGGGGASHRRRARARAPLLAAARAHIQQRARARRRRAAAGAADARDAPPCCHGADGERARDGLSPSTALAPDSGRQPTRGAGGGQIIMRDH